MKIAAVIVMTFFYGAQAIAADRPMLEIIYNPNATPESSRSLYFFNGRDFTKKTVSLKTLLDKATKSLDSNQLSDVDLFNIKSASGELLARVPRFLVWRDRVWIKKSSAGVLSLEVKPVEGLIVPLQVLQVSDVGQIELTQRWKQYPGTHLTMRTNPAATRGEKLFVQNCLTCHSLPGHKMLNPVGFDKENIPKLNTIHQTKWQESLDDRDLRGLSAYISEFNKSVRNEIH